MKGTWLVCIVVLAARLAYAGHSVIVMSDGERTGALQLALSGRGVAVARLPEPEGELRLERAAAAQRAALQLGADAAIWVDPGSGGLEVCAVSPDGRTFRHAPLPADPNEGTARVFAAIAASLVDEMLAPPEGPGQAVDVDVHVHVGADGKVDAVVPPPAMPPAMPPGAAPVLVDSAPPSATTGVPRTDRTLFEIGPVLSPVTIGIEGEVAFPLTSTLRLGLFGGGSRGIGAPVPVIHGGFEVRAIKSGAHDHFDVSFVLGGATANDGTTMSGWDPIGFSGIRFAYTWEGATRATTLSLTPLLATDGDFVAPAAYATLHWGFSL